MKVLIAGLGSIGQRHLRNLRKLNSKIEIIAYRSVGLNLIISDDMSAQPCKDLGKFYDIETFTNYESALEQRPDAVFITCPTSLHIPMALEAAKHNCHLFIEKPLSDSMDGIDELVATVEEKRLVAQVGYQLRFHPALRLIRQLLSERKLGQVLSVHCQFGEYLPNTHPYEDYRQGYAGRKDLGGGVLLCLSHELDYTQWLFGMPRRLFALGGKLGGLEIDVEDTASILMEHTTEGKAIPVHIHLDFVQRPPSRKCSVIGHWGKILWDYYANRVETDWKTFTFNYQRNRAFSDEIRHFINCLKGKDKPIVDIKEGLKSLRIALAAKRSIESGTVEVFSNEC